MARQPIQPTRPAAQPARAPAPAPRPAAAAARPAPKAAGATAAPARQAVRPTAAAKPAPAPEPEPVEDAVQADTTEYDAETGEVYDNESAAADDTGMPAAADDDEVINFAGISDADFPLLPEGWYAAIVDDSEFKFASTGAPMAKMTLKVNGGDYDNQSAWTNIVVTAKALPMVKRNLRALGIELPDGDITMRDLKVWFKSLCDEGHLIGREVYMQIKHKEYKGEQKSEVKRLRSVNDDIDTSGDAFVGG